MSGKKKPIKSPFVKPEAKEKVVKIEADSLEDALAKIKQFAKFAQESSRQERIILNEIKCPPELIARFNAVEKKVAQHKMLEREIKAETEMIWADSDKVLPITGDEDGKSYDQEKGTIYTFKDR